MAVTISWRWYCLSDGRSECPAGDDGVRGMNRHMDETRHGVVQRGVPVK